MSTKDIFKGKLELGKAVPHTLLVLWIVVLSGIGIITALWDWELKIFVLALLIPIFVLAITLLLLYVVLIILSLNRTIPSDLDEYLVSEEPEFDPDEVIQWPR